MIICKGCGQDVENESGPHNCPLALPRRPASGRVEAEAVLEEMRGGSLFDVSPDRSARIIAQALAEERERCAQMGIKDVDRIYKLDELAKGDVMFAATGVTTGDFFKGVRYFSGGAFTHSVVMRSASGTIRWVESEHHFDRKPNFV